MSFYVFDLDGTLADCEHRLSHIQKSPKDWPAFFAACAGDGPIRHTIELLHTLSDIGHRVEIWSGRSDECRAQTEAWLNDCGIDPRRLTFMRRAGDHRNDDDLKREFLNQSDRRPDIVFDDRARVVAMWRTEGVPCFQVAAAEF